MLWADLAIVLVSLAGLAATVLSVWRTVRRFVRNLRALPVTKPTPGRPRRDSLAGEGAPVP